MFPAQRYPFVIESVPLAEPMWYIELIRKWMATKHPIRFIFAGHYADHLYKSTGKMLKVDLNFPASIESFTWKEVAGSPGDIEYTLSLKEYVFYSARRVTPTLQPDGTTALKIEPADRPDPRIRPETFRRRAGEGLEETAVRTLKDSSRWKEIMELNGITWDQLGRLDDFPEYAVLKIPQN